MEKIIEIIWSPHPKQKQALERPEFEILFGGARGGGKTDTGINWLLYDADNPKLRALVIRKNADDLRDWSDRANQIYSKMGAVKAGNPPEFRWPSGAIFRTGHLKDDQAYTKYQGHEYQRMLIEELTQIPNEESYLRLLGSCRSTVAGLEPQVFLTTNPGNTGHSWVKARFVDPSPPETPFKDKISGESRIFIKATIDDNPTLMVSDPKYVKRIDALKDTNEELYRAWRFGDWDVFAGQVFNEFRRNKHVIKQLKPASSYPHYLWIDWGYTAPFACYASAVIRMKEHKTGEVFNRVITYQEWYGVEKTPDEWAEEIYKYAQQRKFVKCIVDPAMLNTNTDGSLSIGKAMIKKWNKLNNNKLWVNMERGNNKRDSQVPIIKNWLSIAPDGLPYWIITERCINLIRTLPLLVYDKHRKEEIDTNSEDHSADSCSYGLKAIKFIGRLGSFGAKGYNINRTFKPLPPVRVDKKGRHLSLDLRYFEKATRKTIDWRAT